MLERILPRSFDNSYRGYGLAVWLMIPIVALRLATGLPSLFMGQLVAQGAHHVPIGAFPPQAVELLGLLFARSGLAMVVLALFCTLVLVRYRAMIPLTYVLLLLDHGGRAFLLVKEATVTGASSATVVGFVLFSLTVIGLILSLLGGSGGASALRGRAQR